MGDPHSAEDASLARWIEDNIGGKVTRIERLARWRPAWDIDVVTNGVLLPLHARGEREENFAIPARIADEIPSHVLLESIGLPVPHAYGLCDEPYALVMDRLAGSVDLSFAADEAEQTAVLDEYLAMLTRMYAIDLAAAAAAGFAIPADSREVALGSFKTYEAIHDSLMTVQEPVTLFLRRWLHRNYPRHRTQAKYITYDSFQFMFDGGRITGLLDFELAHVGDPLMDLAALRVRDTIKNLGDLSAIAIRYGEVTGEELDFDVIDYHTVMYNALTVLSAGPPLWDPVRTTDFISHMAWWVNSARWALEIIADMTGITLETLPPLEAHPSAHAAAYRHLTSGFRAKVTEAPDDYELGTQHKLARHLARIDESGAAALAGDLDDLTVLLGSRPREHDAQRALYEFVANAGPDRDDELVVLLDRRLQRFHQLMAPQGSLMLRHPKLRSVRPGQSGDGSDAEGWPPGAIPGTR